MKLLKKCTAFLLVLGLLFSLASCSLSDLIEILADIEEESETETETGWETVTEEEPETTESETETETASESESETESETETASESETKSETASETEEKLLDENGTYTTKDDVALYIYQYGKLPQNFITKKEAEKLGWPGGSLEPYAPGKCIGGSKFGNYEGILPEKKGRTYTECDIDTLGAKSRGAKRIVFSNDGLIYYTDDHYETFTLLYGEED